MAALTLAPVDPLDSGETWHPDPGGLAEVTALLCASTGATRGHKNMAGLYEQLQSLSNNPYFNNYLAYILARGSANGTLQNGCSLPNDAAMLIVRQAAGLLLKNNLKGVWTHMAKPIREFVMTAVLAALSDPKREIRSVAASCESIMMQVGGRAGVARIIRQLLRVLNGMLGGENGVTGVLLTLLRVGEDKPDVLTPWLAEIMEKVLVKVRSRNSEIKSLALGVINQYLLVLPEEFVARVDGFLRVVFSAATDASDEVRARVCAAVVILLKAHSTVLDPYLQEILPFMLVSCRDASEKVRLEAVAFWPVFCDVPNAKERLLPGLEQVLQILVDGIVYSEEEQSEIEVRSGNDDTVPDRDEDMHPRQFSASDNQLARRLRHVDAVEPASEEEDSADDEEDLEENSERQWSFRKACARALEKLASVVGNDILQVLLPMVEKRLQSDRWAVRESGVLILGALSLDCYDGMIPHLPKVVPFLTSLLSDLQSPVRAISCWTLGRYSKFIVTKASMLAPVYGKLLECALHRNKNVQKAAISSLCELVEAGGTSAIAPYFPATIDMFKIAFRRYQTLNFSNLCDLVATIAKHAEALLSAHDIVNKLLTMMLEKMDNTSQYHPILIPLLACMTDVLRIVGTSAKSFFPRMYSECVRVISSPYTNERLQQYIPSKDYDEEKESIANAFALLCLILEICGDAANDLVDETSLKCAYEAMADPRPIVRLAACEYIGVVAQTRTELLRAASKDFAARIWECMNFGHQGVINNALWALGELVMAVAHLKSTTPSEGNRLMEMIDFKGLVNLLVSGNGDRSVTSNAAVCIGRIAHVYPAALDEQFPHFASTWFLVMKGRKDDEEKDEAFIGVCKLVRSRPVVIAGCFSQFCDAISSWTPVKLESDVHFQELFKYLSEGFGDNWRRLLEQLSQPLRASIQRRYTL